MWHLRYVEFENLFSYPHFHYYFNQGVCTLITGENRDNGGNNGAGKSTIFEAISLALTNRSLRDLTKDSFIRRGEESCAIVVGMENAVLKTSLEVKRWYFRGGKAARVEVWENGERNASLTSVEEANRRVMELIGLTRDDLLRYFIISQDNRYTFFTAGDGEKKEVLNRITAADMINPIVERLADDGKRLSRERAEEGEAVAALKARAEVLREQLETLTHVDNREALSVWQRKVQVTDESIRETERAIARVRKELERLGEAQEQTGGDPNEGIEREEAERGKLERQLDALNQTYSDNRQIQRKAQADLDGSVKCPECGAEFTTESELGLSVPDTRNVLEEARRENVRLEKRIGEMRGQITERKSRIAALKAERDAYDRLVRETGAKKRELGTLQDDIATFQERRERYLGEMKRVREQKQNAAAILTTKERLEDALKELNGREQRLSSLDGETAMNAYWQYYMGRSGFMTYVANRAVSILEGTVNEFLRRFGTSISVIINGFKVLKDGTVRERIEVFALENGLHPEAFMSRSGGERGRISLAGVLAIQRLINLSARGRGLDLLMLDESFAGIDSEGLESIIRILERLGTTTLMITQNVSSEFNNETTIRVVKEGGVSRRCD